MAEPGILSKLAPFLLGGGAGLLSSRGQLSGLGPGLLQGGELAQQQMLNRLRLQQEERVKIEQAQKDEQLRREQAVVQGAPENLRALASAFPAEYAASQMPGRPEGAESPIGKLASDLARGLISREDYDAGVRKATQLTQYGGTPYFTAIPTPDGVMSYNNRTGQMVGSPGPRRAQDDPALQGEISQSEAFGKELGTYRGQTANKLPTIEDKGNIAVQQIDQLLEHPGKGMAVGGSSALQVQRLPGTPAYDFMARFKQVRGGAFLEAFETLKGGGQITEREGQAATEAMTRLDNATSEAEFDAAAKELQTIIRQGMARARKTVGSPVDGEKAAPTGGYKFLGIE